MINKTGFSIIIPSLNQSKFLNDCLKSIHNQKYDNYEIIIVDSKSTDDTAKVFLSFIAFSSNRSI